MPHDCAGCQSEDAYLRQLSGELAPGFTSRLWFRTNRFSPAFCRKFLPAQSTVRLAGVLILTSCRASIATSAWVWLRIDVVSCRKSRRALAMTAWMRVTRAVRGTGFLPAAAERYPARHAPKRNTSQKRNDFRHKVFKSRPPVLSRRVEVRFSRSARPG